MCYEYHGLAFFVQTDENFHDFLRGFRIEVAGRFIRHDDAGTVYECSGNGYTLALAAGQFVRFMVGPVIKAYGFQKMMRPFGAFFSADTGITLDRVLFSSAVILESRLKF